MTDTKVKTSCPMDNPPDDELIADVNNYIGACALWTGYGIREDECRIGCKDGCRIHRVVGEV